MRQLATVLIMMLSVLSPTSWAQRTALTVASTTSTANSGLMEHLLPLAEDALDLDIRLVAVGTGRALKLMELGDVDAVLVHDMVGELASLGAGFAQSRRPVMQNQFIIVGPSDDDLLNGVNTGREALQLLADTAGPRFISRGDDSGTHRAELRLWQQTLSGRPANDSRWYKESGQGMGATIRIAVGLNAYTLTDIGTWGSHGLRDQLAVKIMDDPEMANPYGYLVTNAARHPHVQAVAAERFGDWLRSPAGQAAIQSFRVDQMTLFQPIF